MKTNNLTEAQKAQLQVIYNLENYLEPAFELSREEEKKGLLDFDSWIEETECGTSHCLMGNVDVVYRSIKGQGSIDPDHPDTTEHYYVPMMYKLFPFAVNGPAQVFEQLTDEGFILFGTDHNSTLEDRWKYYTEVIKPRALGKVMG